MFPDAPKLTDIKAFLTKAAYILIVILVIFFTITIILYFYREHMLKSSRRLGGIAYGYDGTKWNDKIRESWIKQLNDSDIKINGGWLPWETVPDIFELQGYIDNLP